MPELPKIRRLGSYTYCHLDEEKLNQHIASTELLVVILR